MLAFAALLYLALGYFSTDTVYSIPIDNGVDGEPEIECGATSITVSFKTRNTFEGKVYVRGHVTESGCVNQDKGQRQAGIILPFATCGLIRTRSLNPRGVFVTASIVISFHAQFLTKVDRAYTIQCFYMEAEKTVSQMIEVSEMSTFFQSQIAPMPVCRYDILENGPTGNPVKFATVGQQVYHKWTCDTETTDTFCMVVHSCFVDDGAGNRVQILTDNGCALDKFILQNLEYVTDLMAGREAHVFKFADRPGLFFQCQISVTIKEPGQACPRPQCAEPTGITSAVGIAAGLPGGANGLPKVPGAKPASPPPPPAVIVATPFPFQPPAFSTTTAPPGGRPATSVNIVITQAPVPQPSHPPSARPTTAANVAIEQKPPDVYAGQTRYPFNAGTAFGSFDDPLNEKDRRKRQQADSAPINNEIGVWDVQSQQMSVFDVDAIDPITVDIQRDRMKIRGLSKSALSNNGTSTDYEDNNNNNSMYCFNQISFIICSCLVSFSFVISTLFSFMYFTRPLRKTEIRL